jgi:hypothetical protein
MFLDFSLNVLNYFFYWINFDMSVFDARELPKQLDALPTDSNLSLFIVALIYLIIAHNLSTTYLST